MTPVTAVIIVSHDSQQVLPLCLQHLEQQTSANRAVFVVDSGSQDTSYLRDLAESYNFQLLLQENIGFSRSNNRALAAITDDTEMVAFINPDTLLPPSYLTTASQLLEEHRDSAAVCGVLEAYDMLQQTPTGKYDSTGIYRKWYGRWYDRDQGRSLSAVQRPAAVIPAACGAALCCRFSVIKKYLPDFFAPEFFLYKEDIELCLRLRHDGYTIWFDPSLHAWHGRGWQKSRAAMPYGLRMQAARSEVLLYRRHPSIFLLWALCKYAAVRWGRY